MESPQPKRKRQESPNSAISATMNSEPEVQPLDVHRHLTPSTAMPPKSAVALSKQSGGSIPKPSTQVGKNGNSSTSESRLKLAGKSTTNGHFAETTNGHHAETTNGSHAETVNGLLAETADSTRQRSKSPEKRKSPPATVATVASNTIKPESPGRRTIQTEDSNGEHKKIKSTETGSPKKVKSSVDKSPANNEVPPKTTSPKAISPRKEATFIPKKFVEERSGSLGASMDSLQSSVVSETNGTSIRDESDPSKAVEFVTAEMYVQHHLGMFQMSADSLIQCRPFLFRP